MRFFIKINVPWLCVCLPVGTICTTFNVGYMKKKISETHKCHIYTNMHQNETKLQQKLNQNHKLEIKVSSIMPY